MANFIGTMSPDANVTGSISPSNISVSGIISQKVLRGLNAYQIAVANGFDGSQADWLQSLRGQSIQFKAEGLDIYYKYESDQNWTLLVRIDQVLANYSVLANKPSIGGVQLIGNKSLNDLGIQASREGYSLVSDEEIERLSNVDNYDDSGIRQAIQAVILSMVTGVKGAAEQNYRIGNVNITPGNIGLGNVDNTADADKNVHSAVQDSAGNVINQTYYCDVDEINGEVFLVRPDGTSTKLMNAEHTHDASEIVSGTIDIARLPAAALERLVDVADISERYALTTATVQNGDTVRQVDTGLMYRVVDDTNLDNAAGYKEYTAGRAAAVPWSGVQNKPATYTPSEHTHTTSDITGLESISVAEARRLSSNAGSSVRPVYFKNGVPVAIAHDLNATVPSDAVFTDTHYDSDIVVAGSSSAKADTSSALQNGRVYINHIENDTVTSSHGILGTGSASVTTDSSGNIVVDAVNTEYSSGEGIDISDEIITNTGVRYIQESSQDGSISVNINGTTTQVSVHGLGSAAFTQSSDYATDDHRHSFSEIQNTPTTLSGYGITDAAEAVHTHDASEIITGTIDIARLPAGVVQRLVTVANQASRFALTSAQVQNGDTVQQIDTGVMYRVVDDTNLDNASGYTPYIAEFSTTAPWSGITNRPESFTPAAHTHTISDIQDIATATVAQAGKLSSNAGSGSQPVYFSGGKPVAIEYEINKSVPVNAQFTDTHFASRTVVSNTSIGTTDADFTIANGSLYLNHVENGDVQSAHRITGTGAVTVRSDTSGNIVINGQDTKYTALPNPNPLLINGKTYDGSEEVTVGVLGVSYGGTGNSSVDSTPVENSTKMVTSGGVYSALQDKADSSHTHQYAGSATAGGSATSAVKLDSNAGSGTQPVYFSGGKPTATTYQLNASVPANAVFTDTHYQSKTVVAGANNASEDTDTSLVNTRVFINHVQNGAVVSSHRISGTGGATVTTDSSGNIIINSESTSYTTLPNPYPILINGQSYDGSETVDVGTIDVAHGGTGNTSVDTTPVQNSTKMVTSGGVYTALSGKSDSDHTHLYAGSSVSGGSASSAVKLDSDAGSQTQPVYFSGGKPVSTTYALNATVPANAVFTDTHYASKTVIAGASDAVTDTDTSLANARVFINHVENGAVTSSHRISGTGATTVTTDSSGNIVINSEDTKYTTLPNPFSLNIKANGTSLGTYDGSEGKEFNITYSNVGAAAASHTHPWTEITNHPTTLDGYGITDQIAAKTHIHDASEIQSGVFDIARIPVAALERLITVADQTEMYALTINDVQLGDTVQREDTGVMYMVIDVSNLDNASGYKSYTAGVASSAPWTGITGKPESFPPSTHTHLYAGSSSVGGSATSAVKLDSDAGSATQPVFFSNGKPAATTYSLNATVPADAVFTDTHHQAKNVVGATNATTDTSAVLSNGNVYINLVENGSVRSSHKIYGSGAATVTTDSSGNIIISSTNTDTKYSAGTGLDLLGTQFINEGVLQIQQGSTNGTISVNTGGTIEEVAVKGLGSAAYTSSTDYATSGHTHSYAGSSSSGGSATSAVKLDSNAGSETQPVYFSGGKPVATTYSLAKSVPADAQFTDTHHTANLITTNSSSGKTQSTTALTNGNVYLNLVENNTVRNSRLISGGADVTVSTDTSGNITISGTDTKYSAGTGLQLSGTTFNNQGVISISQGSTNGTISVNTGGTSAEVSVKGLGSAAYTASTAYATSGHTHTLSLATDSGTSTVTMAANTKYKLTAGGNAIIFTTPVDTKYQSLSAASGGTDVSLVTTGEKATWNAKSNLTIGSTSTTAAAGNHTHSLDIATSTGTNSITLSAGTKYQLTAGGSTYIFTTPTDSKPTAGAGISVSGTAVTNTGVRSIDTGSANGTISVNTNGTTADVAVKGLGSAAYTASTAYAASGHTHSYAGSSSSGGSATSAVKLDSDAGSTSIPVYFSGGKPVAVSATSAAASGGTTLTLVTTGEKYTWNNKSNLVIGTTSSTAAAGNHTHGLSLATDTGTSSISLSANTKYKLTAGGSTYVFTTPVDTKYESKAASSGGTDVSLVTTGEKATWNAKSNLAIGTTSTTAAAGNHTHGLSLATDSGTSSISLAASTKYKLTAGGSTYIFTTPADSKPAAGTGISVSGVTVTNAGVRSIATGSSNGTISVNTNGTSADVAVKGLGAAAYMGTGTSSTTVALGNHTHDYGTTTNSTDTSSKIFLIGATSQAASQKTYSDNEVYVTNGVLTTKSVQVGGTAATIQYNSTTQSIDFVFA